MGSERDDFERERREFEEAWAKFKQAWADAFWSTPLGRFVRWVPLAIETRLGRRSKYPAVRDALDELAARRRDREQR